MSASSYIYKTPHLCMMLGISRMTLYNWEKTGRFTAPRNFRGDRVFTEEQMAEIFLAFEPGGEQKWHFKPDAQTKQE